MEGYRFRIFLDIKRSRVEFDLFVWAEAHNSSIASIKNDDEQWREKVLR